MPCYILARMNPRLLVFAGALLGCGSLLVSAQEPAPSGAFTTAQAEAGRAAYEKSCGQCHTYAVTGRSGKEGELPPLESLPAPYLKFIGPRKRVPPLVGKQFVDKYGQKTLREMFVLFRGAANSTPVSVLKMSDETLVDITAYILAKNGGQAGNESLTADSPTLFHSVVASH